MRGPRRRRQPGLLLSELAGGDGIVVSLHKRAYYPLSKSGVLLWRLYDQGPADDETLVTVLRERFDVDEHTAARDVRAFVEQLSAQDMLALEATPSAA